MISQADLIRLQARTGKEIEVSKTGVEKEQLLHEQIIDYCKSRGVPWMPVHSRMDRPHTNAVGTVDFIIAAGGGRTIWVEAKRRGGKVSPAQNATIAWLKRLSHEVHVVTSIEQFRELVA